MKYCSAGSYLSAQVIFRFYKLCKSRTKANVSFRRKGQETYDFCGQNEAFLGLHVTCQLLQAATPGVGRACVSHSVINDLLC